MAIEELSYIGLEDGTRKKASATNLTEGQAVSLDANGELIAATEATKVYGICKADSNQFADFAFGEFGAFGSGQLTVVTRGVMRLAASVYNQTEVDSSTTIASAPTTIKVFDDGVTFAVGDTLFVDSSNLITNAGAGTATSILGKVLATPAQTGGSLELELDPGATGAVGDFA